MIQDAKVDLRHLEAVLEVANEPADTLHVIARTLIVLTRTCAHIAELLEREAS